MRALSRSLGPLALLALGACGGGSRLAPTAPVEPEAAIRGFMDAVKANSFVAMSELWGTSKGPAVRWMDRQLLDQRLTVMHAYLVHETFEIHPPKASRSQAQGERAFEVTITRKGCSSAVPFTLVAFGGGWLVKAVDLGAAGTPPRDPCGSTPAAATPPR